MHPSIYARTSPRKAALVMVSDGQVLDFEALERLSNQSAHALRELGLKRGDVVATIFGNGPEVFNFSLAAQRAGLYLTLISNRLSAEDAGYIVADCGARVVIASDKYLELAKQACAASSVPVYGWTTTGTEGQSWSSIALAHPISRISDESPGTDMLYSSGTTGRPKGVKFPLPEGAVEDETPLMAMGRTLYGMGEDTVYLSTSPLYHAAPLRWAIAVLRLGGSVVVMDRFDPEETLRLIEKFKITHSTFVPTHFVRMLRLPDDVRRSYDLSSLAAVVHAAAPCPPAVKRAMIAWWGPIIHEYYSGTETCGITAISPQDWLERPGSVGRAVLGELRISDDNANPLPPRTIGNVTFAKGQRFEYHNDPEKTAQAYDRNGYASMGDLGWVDEEGYLYLTDRKSFTIISGGVNIYPLEIENCLITHPKVADVAVIGIPDEEMGESVLAVIQPVLGVSGDRDLAEEIHLFAKAALGGLKAPRLFDFRSELPREATGKLKKRFLVDEFGAGARPAFAV